jgi:5-methyltetrahydrofolate--homocysteine methyltransferase
MEYIEKIGELRNLYGGFEKKERVRGNYICSSTKSVCIDDNITIIGERINPSGNKKLKEAFLEGRYEYATNVAFEQINNGATILDVNTSLPQIDELEYMKNIIDTFNGLIDTPLQIDSTKSAVVEEALRRYPGISIVNSVSGKQSSMDKLFPIIKKYGAYAVGLCLDEDGIPKTAKQRFDIAEKIILNAKKHGIPEDRLLIDTLVLTASAQQSEVMETVRAISLIKEKYNVKTTLGVSNVSYGLPFRGLINRVFFTMALTAGLDTAIIDPSADGIIDTVKAFNVLSNKDQGATEYIEYNNNKPETAIVVKTSSEKKAKENTDVDVTAGEKNLHTYLLEGDEAEVLNITKNLLSENKPLEIVNNHLIPALDNIGNLYESRSIYLPQLIRAAETVKIAFSLIKETLEKETSDFESKGSIIMATVKGDVHDIGKNLVKIMLESYGYKVVDLGKDVPADAVIKAIKEQDIKMIGLSALMTTTVNSMEEIIKEVRENTSGVKIFVGGAILTEEYSKKIGADYYCKDARESVLVANEYFK